MKKFEYYRVYFNDIGGDITSERFNEAGYEGWELVVVIHLNQGNGYAFFKREIK